MQTSSSPGRRRLTEARGSEKTQVCVREHSSRETAGPVARGLTFRKNRGACRECEETSEETKTRVLS